MKNQRPYLRFIEGIDGGANAAESGGDTAQGGEPVKDTAGDDSAGEVVDYKAKYEAMKSHSREWEAKAKANLAAAKELEELKEAGKTELEKLTDRAAKAEAERDSIKAELDRMTIANEHGISAQDAALFLHGSVDDMRAQAEALAGRGKDQDVTRGLGVNPAQGRGAGSSRSREAIVARAKEL